MVQTLLLVPIFLSLLLGPQWWERLLPHASVDESDLLLCLPPPPWQSEPRSQKHSSFHVYVRWSTYTVAQPVSQKKQHRHLHTLHFLPGSPWAEEMGCCTCSDSLKNISKCFESNRPWLCFSGTQKSTRGMKGWCLPHTLPCSCLSRKCNCNRSEGAFQNEPHLSVGA